MSIIQKPWGREELYCNTDLYCLKDLYFEANWCNSLHRHKVKSETFILINGRAFVEINDTKVELETKIPVHIQPGTWHRIWADKDSLIREVSTHHDENDIERVTTGYNFTESLEAIIRHQKRAAQ